MIRILVVDDHPVVRDGLALVLGTQPDFEVVGEASDGAQAVAKACELRPDVILLDLEMPGVDGLSALHQFRQKAPEVRVIVFTAFDTDERIIKAVQAGAKGYLLKGAPRAELFEAVRVVAAGGSLLQPVVASKLMRHMSEPAADALTEREMDVLRLMAKGMPNKEIAAALVVTERTVKFHISAILSKLGAGNRTEAVRVGVQRGLVRLD
jgi:DNA-binding NarL/FixJ family response regulator